MPISERAKQLIPKARIVSFDTWKPLFPQAVIDIFQQADDEGRYLSDEELAQIQSLGQAVEVATAREIRDRVTDIVAQARAQVLAKFPNISSPGGDLYPPERAEACWRDFWHFLRCITYGITSGQTQFTSASGLANMELLYQELRVPLPAMVAGLEALKVFSLQPYAAQQQEQLAPYFDHLIKAMKQF